MREHCRKVVCLKDHEIHTTTEQLHIQQY
jgi:hypothetical protein